MMRRIVLLALAWVLAVSLSMAQDHHSTSETSHEGDGHAVSHETESSTEDHGTAEHHETAMSEDHGDGHAVADHGEHAEKEGGDVMGYLAHHLLDSDSYDLLGYTFKLPVIKGDFSFIGEKYAHGLQVTKHMIGFLTAALLTIILIIPTTRKTKNGGVPSGFGNFLEVLVLFVRDEVVYANIGKKDGKKWLPFFLTLFFLILFTNLLGMIPFGTSATGNVNFTAGLAIAVLIAVIFAGIKAHGFKYLGTFVPHGVPLAIAPIIFPIEIFGLLVKHFALTIRLFANMLAGHTVIGVFLALILTPMVAFAAVPGAVVISMLELFVAFLQAYVFVMLGSLFVGASIHAH